MNKRIIPIIIPFIFLMIWIGIAGKIDNQVILPKVGQVLELLLHPFQDVISMGSFASNIIVSLARVLTGYCLAVIIGVPLGVLMGYYALVFKLFNNFLNLFRPIPPLAWVPLVMAWFGVASFATILGIETGKLYIYLNNVKFSMIFIIFIGAFYPILTSSIHGVRNINQTLIYAAKVLGANQHQIFRKILMPAAMPSIVSGLRIGLGIAWMCLVSAEMLPGSLSGIGYLITHAYTLASTEIVIAGMISIALIGAFMDFLFYKLETNKFSWQRLSK